MNTAKNPSMHDRHTRRLARVSLLLSLLLATPGFTGQPTGRGVTPEPGSQTPTASFRMAAPAETTTPAPRELPSDAEMIAHFQAHRKEFEELVRLYQTDERRNKVGNRQPFWTQPYNELLARVGLSHITDDGALWLPDPYSVETTKKARAMDVFQAFAHHGLIFVVENRTFSVRVRRLVWKDYFYVPVVPRVEDGQLLWPRSRHGGDLHRSAPVFALVDHYPPDWLLNPPRGASCVFRQIESQWFLSLCRSR